jgi:hypothetical protein
VEKIIINKTAKSCACKHGAHAASLHAQRWRAVERGNQNVDESGINGARRAVTRRTRIRAS